MWSHGLATMELVVLALCGKHKPVGQHFSRKIVVTFIELGNALYNEGVSIPILTIKVLKHRTAYNYGPPQE